MLNPIRTLERLAARSLEVPCPVAGLGMPCWVWQGPPNRGGYGNLNVKHADGWRPMLNHRAAYLILIGDIPSGLEPDHLCRVRLCWNPWHLDPVTRTVNIRRGLAPSTSGAWLRAKTHCPQGHPYDEGNTCRRNGRRHCRACDRERRRQ
jgi:hypothetical protein